MKMKERSRFYRSRDKAIKKLYEGGATKSGIGRIYGISRERVRQIINWVNSGFDKNYGK